MKKLTTLLALTALLVGNIMAQTVLLTQDFESGSLPSGWTRTQNTPSVGWEFGDNEGTGYFPIPAHTKYAASNDDAHDDNTATANKADRDRLITPVINLTSYASSGIILEFDYIQPSAYGSIGVIEATLSNGVIWSALDTVEPTATWKHATVNLSLYAGDANLKVAFRHNDKGLWADGFGIDNVVIRTAPVLNASLEAVSIPTYVVSGSTPIKAIVKNEGYQPITKLLLKYTIDGGTENTEPFTSLNIALGASAELTFVSNANLSTGGHNICVTIQKVNDVNDTITVGNSICQTISALTSIPTKKPILERYVGAWAQFSPDGDAFAETIRAQQQDVIQVAVHNTDAMEISDASELFTAYIGGYPSGTIDRYKFEGEAEVALNRGQWADNATKRLNDITPIAVSFDSQTWDSATRTMTVKVKADFKAGMTGDFRFNLFVIEDSVTGTGTGYDQSNYYNTVAGHAYYGMGNPVYNYTHRDVLRAMLGGAWGTSGVLPSSINGGQNFTHTYTYTVPDSFNLNRISLVAMVQSYDADPNLRQIHNAEKMALDLSPEVIIEEPNGINEIAQSTSKVYPNPFADKANIEINLEANAEVNATVYDMSGRMVKQITEGFMNSGTHTITWYGNTEDGPLASNGQYLVVLNINGEKQVLKLALNR
jgi:hypothetical protein